jgi:uncharacterized protein YdhG (YjbR/CyaY superfamily)
MRMRSEQKPALQNAYILPPGSVRRRMAAKKPNTDGEKKSARGFTAEERAAAKDMLQERKIVWGKNKADDERVTLAKISQMPEPDRFMAKRLHEIITTSAPNLSPRLWYGMPAYTKEGEVLCFFQPAHKFKARYGTLGFNDEAMLDEGSIWPTAYAVKELNALVEARVVALVKKAVG